MRSRQPGRRPLRLAAILASVTALSLAAGACTKGSASNGGGETPAAPAAKVDMAAELAKPATITFWAWTPDIQSQVNLFQKKYPNIKVNLVNPGQGPPAYQKFRTALKGGGAPDVMQLEFSYINSYKITGDLLDLSPYGANDIKGDFVDFAWNQVAEGDKVYAIPQDAGPMGMLYREDIFKQYGLTVPKTWEEFAAQAKKLHDADPKKFMTNLPPNDSGAVLGLMQQAGSRPFGVTSKEQIKINMVDEGAKKWANYWTPLIQQGLVSTDATFNNDWYQALSSGKYATWLAAAWGPSYLQGAAAASKGKWRAAPLPQWSAGENVSGNWGGSVSAVTAKSKSPAAAAAFAMFINHDPESANLLASKQLTFPVTKPLLEDPKFTDQKVAFYGGQQVFKLFADISKTVDPTYQWGPYQDYVNQKNDETIGKAMTAKADLNTGLQQLQDSLVNYGKQQGFTVATQ
jgi:multiple sugar transport system substrate-binding protein